jgi:hypothetical protein
MISILAFPGVNDVAMWSHPSIERHLGVSGLRTVAGGETVGGCAPEAGRCPRAALPRDDRTFPPGNDLQDEEIVAPESEETMVVSTMASMPRDLAET